ncbi:IclR family transcriptional regulator [Herbiconiux sp. YIM B11900]|uniref:IclR family transcriptional regulator n=1 Tax=Herbiconiux sp. YIM B11900 TaxID=3404131 RepID=UPI003F85B2DE
MDDEPSDATTHAAAVPASTDEVPAARRTLQVLRFLSAQRGPVAASTIATALGLPRSSTYKILAVLEEEGFVLHLPEARRFGLGVSAFELSSGYSRQTPLARLGAPLLAALVDRIGESAHLAILHGRDVLYLVDERAPHRPALVTEVGVRLPSHLTASGRAMLAALPPKQLRALFPDRTAFAHRTDVGPHSGPQDYGSLKRLLENVRRRGYAEEDGDVVEGLVSVSVAVLDHTGWPAAAIAVTSPADAVAVDHWPAIAHEIATSARELGRRIRGAPG